MNDKQRKILNIHNTIIGRTDIECKLHTQVNCGAVICVRSCLILSQISILLYFYTYHNLSYFYVLYVRTYYVRLSIFFFFKQRAKLKSFTIFLTCVHNIYFAYAKFLRFAFPRRRELAFIEIGYIYSFAISIGLIISRGALKRRAVSYAVKSLFV